MQKNIYPSHRKQKTRNAAADIKEMEIQAAERQASRGLHKKLATKNTA